MPSTSGHSKSADVAVIATRSIMNEVGRTISAIGTPQLMGPQVQFMYVLYCEEIRDAADTTN